MDALLKMILCRIVFSKLMPIKIPRYYHNLTKIVFQFTQLFSLYQLYVGPNLTQLMYLKSLMRKTSHAIPFVVLIIYVLANVFITKNNKIQYATVEKYPEVPRIRKSDAEKSLHSKKSKKEKVLMMRPEKTKTKKVLTQDELFASADAHNEAAMESFVLSEPVVQYEKQLKMKWDKAIKNKKSLKVMPNPDFVFHNKLPKSGSTTMKSLVKQLSIQNDFNFLKIQSGTLPITETSNLIKYLHEEGEFKKPFFLLKHHEYFNFTEFRGEQPTYINVIREPISWFTSRYYFARFGWERKPGVREDQFGALTEEDINMDIDECVERRLPRCMLDTEYITFFCGHERECFNATTYAQKRIAVERAKNNILNNFFVVGILEQFSDTLKVFERLMPKYYKGVQTTLASDVIQNEIKSTKTSFKKEMSEKSKEFLRNGPFHHEIELYEFAKKIFNKRMKDYLNM